GAEEGVGMGPAGTKPLGRRAGRGLLAWRARPATALVAGPTAPVGAPPTLAVAGTAPLAPLTGSAVVAPPARPAIVVPPTATAAAHEGTGDQRLVAPRAQELERLDLGGLRRLGGQHVDDLDAVDREVGIGPQHVAH